MDARTMTHTEATDRALPSADFYDGEDGVNRCFLCGDPHYTLKYETERFGFPIAFYECGCSTIKQVPMPNKKFFDWFFNSATFFAVGQVEKDEIWGYSDYFAEERARELTSALRMRRLSRYFRPDEPLEVMKIGPSTGTFLMECQRRGHHVRGCDVSATFAAKAKELHGLDIDVGRFEERDYADGQFDRIMLLNVIENVPNQEEFLGAIRRTLKPGGYFIFNYVEMRGNLVAAVQKSNYFLVRPPVTYMFTRSGVERMLADRGFRIEATLRDIRVVNLEKVTGLFRMKLLTRAMRATRLNRLLLPLWAYPSYIVVARKLE
jgi:2-polyprenyl-3-methyl-5-hydroxy-6-metoxy-1,4-benzoquinol methylase